MQVCTHMPGKAKNRSADDLGPSSRASLSQRFWTV